MRSQKARAKHCSNRLQTNKSLYFVLLYELKKHCICHCLMLHCTHKTNTARHWLYVINYESLECWKLMQLYEMKERFHVFIAIPPASYTAKWEDLLSLFEFMATHLNFKSALQTWCITRIETHLGQCTSVESTYKWISFRDAPSNKRNH